MQSPVATVVLRTRVHCEGCAQKIKKIVGKYDGESFSFTYLEFAFTMAFNYPYIR